LSSPEVSVVIPVYNEEENLPILAAELHGTLRPLKRSYEVLFVDDGSIDRSPEILARLQREDPAVRVIRLKRNAGQSAALEAGFRFARGAVVVTLDADLQNDPADIPALLAKIGPYDVVCGVRAQRQDSWMRKASSRIANGVRNRWTRESITDVGCTLKAYRVEFLRRIPMFTGMHRFLPTLLRMEGARVTEMPVHHRPRLHGTPKYNIRNRIWRALVDLFAVRWMQRRWIDRNLAEEALRTATGEIAIAKIAPATSAESSARAAIPLET
jgi:dolichol-phosphate mannosyltransferase